MLSLFRIYSFTPYARTSHQRVVALASTSARTRGWAAAGFASTELTVASCGVGPEWHSDGLWLRRCRCQKELQTRGVEGEPLQKCGKRFCLDCLGKFYVEITHEEAKQECPW